MTPAKAHMHVHTLLSVGMLLTNTVGLPGIHGATVTGVQGIGVGVPNAAAVAAITAGLVGLVHIPKGLTFIKGI